MNSELAQEICRDRLVLLKDLFHNPFVTSSFLAKNMCITSITVFYSRMIGDLSEGQNHPKDISLEGVEAAELGAESCSISLEPLPGHCGS